MTGNNGVKRREGHVVMWPGVLLALVLAGFAFFSSFDALRIVFMASGMSQEIAWMGPLCVDGIVGLCTWAVWGFKKSHTGSTWYPWAGFLLFGCLSVVGNMLHARAVTVNGTTLPDWAPPIIMSIPPVAFMYATHLIVIVASRRLANQSRAIEERDMEPTVEQPERESALDGLSDFEDIPEQDETHHNPAPAPLMTPTRPMPTPPVEPVVESSAPVMPVTQSVPPVDDILDRIPVTVDYPTDRQRTEDMPFDREQQTTPMAVPPVPVPQEPVKSEPAVTPVIPTVPVSTPEPAVQPEPVNVETERIVRPVVKAAAKTVSTETEPAETGDETSQGEDVEDSKIIEDRSAGQKDDDAKNSGGVKPDADWYAWAKELARQGRRPTQGGALEAGLAPNLSAVKRTLKRLRNEDPELFGANKR
ncbi:hypothetical protein CSQ85_11715 [Bifidobacterium rousetti]|uniref:DUF2637 domain-containing protein n=1 Tax=Bifidobacterium rousetti TaxID=2045439 RepID=UPI00123C723C|nr:DUF2637 domain-containing protein [Bifidobacterium rousetti]KAA8816767.1 hypothetical protein CSQ85_11715 [Bifidobacterium rousetti]